MSKHIFWGLFLGISFISTLSFQKHSLQIRTIGEAMTAFPMIVDSVTMINSDVGNQLNKATEPLEDVGQIMLTIAHLLDTIDPLLTPFAQTKDRMVCAIGSKESRQKTARCKDLKCLNRNACVKKIIGDIKAMLTVFVDHVIKGVTDGNRTYTSILDSALKVSKQEQVKADLEPVLKAIKITIQILNEIEKLIK